MDEIEKNVDEKDIILKTEIEDSLRWIWKHIIKRYWKYITIFVIGFILRGLFII